MIDIVIPTCAKDFDTLELVIDHARKYIANVANIYVISESPCTQNAIHIAENLYPFTKSDIKAYNPTHRCHWYYQQLLKLYAHKVIPLLKEDFLILDSETIFYKPVWFIDNDGKALYCVSNEKNPEFYRHMVRMLPCLSSCLPMGISPTDSGIVHHMLFQNCVLNEIFNQVEMYHNKPLWQVFMEQVDQRYLLGGGASEYEIYFCFAFTMFPQKVKIRPLVWDISNKVLTDSNHHFLTAHAHLREKSTF